MLVYVSFVYSWIFFAVGKNGFQMEDFLCVIFVHEVLSVLEIVLNCLLHAFVESCWQGPAIF